MKIRVKTENPVMVIEKSKKDYDFNGNKGTSYKAIIMVKYGDETQVDEVRVTDKVFPNLKPMTHYEFAGHFDTKNNRLEFDMCSVSQQSVK